MTKYKLAFVAFDSAKEKHAVAIAEDGRDGEVCTVPICGSQLVPPSRVARIVPPSPTAGARVGRMHTPENQVGFAKPMRKQDTSTTTWKNNDRKILHWGLDQIFGTMASRCVEK
jgi:hypothetical protein